MVIQKGTGRYGLTVRYKDGRTIVYWHETQRERDISEFKYDSSSDVSSTAKKTK